MNYNFYPSRNSFEPKHISIIRLQRQLRNLWANRRPVDANQRSVGIRRSTMGSLTVGYVVRRLGMFLLTVWLGTTLIFMIPRMAPGAPVAAMVSRISAQSGNVSNSAEMIASWRKRFGLDEPIMVQYVRYIYNASTFQLGPSLAHFPANVQDMVARAIPWTLGLLSLATPMAFIAGNVVGAS